MGGCPRFTLLACKCCRVKMTEEEQGTWRAERAVKMMRLPFKPNRRMIAVMVLVMYSLFPSLVRSAASIFNCTDLIEGRRYLVADLTVTCYEGWHAWYVVAATFFVVLFCIGIPFVFTVLVSFETCICRRNNKDDKYKRLRCLCRSRADLPWGYRTSSIRERLGLLVFGYDTHRGALIMSWEALIGMPRKLLITLAGSLVRDPYLQIMLALLILIFSLTLQALVQPYESPVLNALDVGSLLVLIVTQVISILYLYLDSVDDSALPSWIVRKHLELTTTALLFLVNAGVIVGLFTAWIAKAFYEKIAESKKKAKKIKASVARSQRSIPRWCGLLRSPIARERACTDGNTSVLQSNAEETLTEMAEYVTGRWSTHGAERGSWCRTMQIEIG